MTPEERIAELERMLKRAEDLISRHELECAHTRKLADGTRDPHYSDIFLLADEDSYDVCTCLKGFVPARELEAAHAAVRGVGKIRQMLESTEKSRKDLQGLLLELAPFVAVHARNPLISPDGRRTLLDIEPRMLEVLQHQPKEPL